MPRITIVIADDHKLVRQGMRSLFETHPGFEVIGEASDGLEAVKLIGDLLPDIALLDVMMPNLNGVETAKLIQQRGFRTKVIFLSMYANAMYAVRGLQSGALGYVLKDSDFSEILQAIEIVLKGKRYISTAIADEVLEMLLKTDTGKDESLEILSAREREILQLIAEGRTIKEIAALLNISPKTVEFHKAQIIFHLNLRTTAELTKYALAHGLTSA